MFKAIRLLADPNTSYKIKRAEVKAVPVDNHCWRDVLSGQTMYK